MRKAAWGAVALAVFAVSNMRPVASVEGLHQLLGLGLLVGYVLIGLDPPTSPNRLWPLLLAGFVASLVGFFLVFGSLPNPPTWVLAVAGLLAVAAIALPLWLLARPMQPVFGAAAAAAVLGPFLEGRSTMGPSDWASIAAFGLAATGALWNAARLAGWRPTATGETRRPRIAVAYDVVQLTPQEKAERIARLDARLAAGEIPEHKYWDLRQEIESK